MQIVKPKIVTRQVPGFWEVVHQCYRDNDLGYKSTMVQAQTQADAQAKFNKMADQRREYPYFWKRVGLGSVTPMEVEDIED